MIDIVNAQSLSNSTSSNGEYHGLTVGVNTENFTIIGGSFRESALFGANKQGYGIFLNEGYIDNFVISGCNCRGNIYGALNDLSTGTNKTISSVMGYKTKNEGTAQLLSGHTTVSVTHGLGKAPINHNITITNLINPAACGVGGADFWVSAVSSTTFTISCSSAPTNSMWIGWTVDISGY